MHSETLATKLSYSIVNISSLASYMIFTTLIWLFSAPKNVYAPQKPPETPYNGTFFAGDKISTVDSSGKD